MKECEVPAVRRLFSFLVVLVMLCGCGFASETFLAQDIALKMAENMPEMQDVREAALEDASNRVIWTDSRTNQKCALMVYADASEAEKAAVTMGTRYTSVRAVENCLLAIDSDLSMAVIDDYTQLLADILDVEIVETRPDYILNVNTKKFHYPDCSSVKEMKESNKQEYSGVREELIAQSYEACKRCNP